MSGEAVVSEPSPSSAAENDASEGEHRTTKRSNHARQVMIGENMRIVFRTPITSLPEST